MFRTCLHPFHAWPAITTQHRQNREVLSQVLTFFIICLVVSFLIVLPVNTLKDTFLVRKRVTRPPQPPSKCSSCVLYTLAPVCNCAPVLSYVSECRAAMPVPRSRRPQKQSARSAWRSSTRGPPDASGRGIRAVTLAGMSSLHVLTCDVVGNF